jgi:D-glucosaminate-6-phosphate ammonia-lyase
LSYADVGVRSFINCCGTRTIHSGSLMLPCVRDAMMAASRSFVNMDELMEGVGTRLAALTGAESAIVTSGGAAALCVAAAAAVTGGDPERIQRLPQLRGVKDRVVMLRSGRFTYDQAIRAVGATIVEVETVDELAAELMDERTAMVALLGTDVAGLMSIETVAAQTTPRGIPLLVDAASEHLHKPNPYLDAGATMVAYSGGKYLRGPQCTGLLLGAEGWLRAAWTNAAPHHTFARMMKVGKEEIMGLLAAVEYWATERDDGAELAAMNQQLQTISDCVTETDGVTTEMLLPKSDKSPTPRLQITWPEGWIHGLELRGALLDSDPRIMLDDRGATANSVFILPFSLQEGEAEIVGNRLRQMLVPGIRATGHETVIVDVSGLWDIEIALHASLARHSLALDQVAGEITGSHRTEHVEHEAKGMVQGRRVQVTAEHPFEGTNLVYTFQGEVRGDRISGDVEIGTEGQSAPGPLNRREYGSYPWHGQRAAASDRPDLPNSQAGS